MIIAYTYICDISKNVLKEIASNLELSELENSIKKLNFLLNKYVGIKKCFFFLTRLARSNTFYVR